jgi:hypothetical protein
MLSQGLGRPCGRRRGIMPRWQVPSPAPRARRRRQAATSFLQRVYQGFSETRRGSPSRSMCKCNTLNTYDGGNICRTTQANHASIFARKIYRRPFYIQPVSPWIRSDPIDFLCADPLHPLQAVFKKFALGRKALAQHQHCMATPALEPMLGISGLRHAAGHCSIGRAAGLDAATPPSSGE